MNSWKKRILLTLAGLGLATGALTACGHRPHAGDADDHARHRDRIMQRVAGKLDLDDGQKKRLAVLADQLQAQRAALVAPGGDPRAEVRALVAGAKFDRGGAQALLAAKTAALATGSPGVIAAMADFYDSLDPAQQAKLRELMERRGHGWRRG